MRWRIERWLFGFLAGWWFTFHGERLGPDLFALPAADPFAAAAWRGATFFGCAAILSVPLVHAPVLALFGAASGFVLGRLVLGWPGSESLWTLLPVALLVVAVLVQMRRMARTLEDPEPAPEELPTNLGERICYAVAGGGAALALEAVARHVELFSSGVARDEHAFDATFLVLALVGAAAFGGFARLSHLRKLAFPVLLAALGSSAYVSLAMIDSIGDFRGLDEFVRKFGSDLSWHGTLAFDALLAAAIYVVPAFVLGALVCSTRRRSSLLWASAGAAAGVAIVPWLLRHAPDASTGEAETFAAHFVVVGALVGVVGATLGIVFDTRRSGFARIAGIASAALCALPVPTVVVKPIFVLSPWGKFPVLPFLAFETPTGLATVEPSRGNFKLATIDRRAVTPELAQATADVRRIEIACELLAPAKRAAGKLRVLWIGQMSVVRASVLEVNGVERVDRSAAWWPAMERLEAELFGDTPRPAGDVVPPDEARERLENGAYDLVIAPPVAGDMPSFGTIEAPRDTLVVRWFGIDEPPLVDALPRSTFFEDGQLVERAAVVVASHGFEDLALGLVTHGHLASRADAQRPLVLDFDPALARRSPLALLFERKVFRIDAQRALFGAALAAGAEGTPDERVIDALGTFLAAQTPSSPWETAAQQIELPDAVLEALAADARERAPTPFVRGLWEWTARVLVEKREVQRIDRFVKPVADAHGPWVVLSWALARADVEALDPAAAAARMRPLATSDMRRVEVWYTLAEAEELSGELAAAARAWRRAAELAPQDPGIARRLAMALVRSGDPEGRAHVERILAEHPEDEDLKPFLGPGPFPPPVFTPTGGAHDH